MVIRIDDLGSLKEVCGERRRYLEWGKKGGTQNEARCKRAATRVDILGVHNSTLLQLLFRVQC